MPAAWEGRSGTTALHAAPVVDAEEVKGGAAVGDSPPPPKGNRIAIVTGASSGIGLATAEGMARSGLYDTIILAGRDAQKHKRAIASLHQNLGVNMTAMEFKHIPLEMDSLASVREFAADFLDLGLPLHTLVLNAGVMALPERRETQDGYEYQMGVNHLAHFLLTNLLLDRMVSCSSPGEPGRVIVLSSSAHSLPSALLQGDLDDMQSTRMYTPMGAYAQSKLANVMFAYELDRRCAERGLPISANAVHPGVVNTELFRYNFGGGRILTPVINIAQPLLALAVKTPEDGARTSVMLATKQQGKLSGRFWQDERPAASVDLDPTGDIPKPIRGFLPVQLKFTSYEPATWSALWRRSVELVDLKPNEVACFRDA